MTKQHAKFPPSAPFLDGLHKRLKNPKMARGFLAACLEESEPTFLRGIQEVAKANGITVEELAKRADLNRVSLQRIYSGKTSPGFSTVRRLLDGLNIDLAFAPKKKNVGA